MKINRKAELAGFIKWARWKGYSVVLRRDGKFVLEKLNGMFETWLYAKRQLARFIKSTVHAKTNTRAVEQNANVLRGACNPYDDPAQGELKYTPSKDWARNAVRGVLNDLSDRRGIGHELVEVDHDIRPGLVDDLVVIVHAAHDIPMPASFKE